MWFRKNIGFLIKISESKAIFHVIYYKKENYFKLLYISQFIEPIQNLRQKYIVYYHDGKDTGFVHILFIYILFYNY